MTMASDRDTQEPWDEADIRDLRRARREQADRRKQIERIAALTSPDSSMALIDKIASVIHNTPNADERDLAAYILGMAYDAGLRAEPDAGALRAALRKYLIEWKFLDQPDKPRSVVERWADWFIDNEVPAATPDAGTEP